MCPPTGNSRPPTEPPSRPRRVLLVDSTGYADRGGAASVIHEVLLRADRTRFEPVLACLTEGAWPEEARELGIPAYSLPRTRLRSPANLRSIVGGLRRIVRDEAVDLVHASENTALLYSGLAALGTGIPLVWHVHSPLQPRSLEERLVAALLPRLRPSHVVFTSSAAEARSVRFGGAPTSVVVPGVDLARCAAGDADRARSALGIPAGARLVSMFARVVPEKGAATFVEAVGGLAAGRPDLHAVLCGPGDRQGAFWRGLEDRRRALGLEDRLLLPGDVRPPLKDDVAAASAVVLHTSPAESFGLAVLEAMAAGRPVVASAADGPRLLIESGVDGVLVPPGDVAGVVAAAGALLDDPDVAHAMGARAARSAARYPIDETVRRLEALWAQVLTATGGRSRPRPQSSPSHHRRSRTARMPSVGRPAGGGDAGAP